MEVKEMGLGENVFGYSGVLTGVYVFTNECKRQRDNKTYHIKVETKYKKMIFLIPL